MALRAQMTWIDTLGSFGFSDINDLHIGRDADEEWGVLIGFQEMSMVGRDHVHGTLTITVDPFLQFDLAGTDLRQVQLNGLGTS